ncbi:hypothetical protein [Hyalangium sp.]|uniref:hypothetical protein n=1 Tax=Hyalangium sp. TaxID=2028555 RepID=UPI002D2DBF92|nr:hypothetical protein [Hyalangium sp.]HYH96563.1 hypothetical protein [Hyalangium sp.]
MDTSSHVRKPFSPFPWLLAMALAVGALGCPGSGKCDEQPEACDPPTHDEDAGTGDAGTGDAGTPDSGTPDSGTPDSGIVDPNTSMLLTKIDAFYSRQGLELRPRDYSASPPQLFPNDGGTPVPGIALEPGRVRFDVPPGTYLVKTTSIQYLLVSWRSVDISTRLYGRPDRGDVFFPNPATASLNLSGLAPDPDPFWPNYSYLNFHSLDVEDSGSFYLPQELVEGQPSLVATDAEYNSDYGNIPRFDPAQGDTAWVVQTLERDAGVEPDGGAPVPYTSLVRAAHVIPFAFDGGTFSVEATLQPAPQQTLRFDWRRDEFNALRIASTTGSPSISGFVDVYPALKTAQEGWFDYSISAMLSFVPRRTDVQAPLVKELSYGNPYPTGWEPMAQFTSLYSFNVTNHDGSRTQRTSETFLSTEAVSDLASTPVRPRISLPRDFQVDGMPATTPRILGTATPLVTWEQPALGPATGYTLLISRYNVDLGFMSTIARIYLGPDERSLRLPPGLLTSGNEYMLRITAQHMPGVRTERGWFTLVVPSASATTGSALLTVQ